MATREELVLNVQFNGGEAERNVAALTARLKDLTESQKENSKEMAKGGEKAQEAAARYVENTKAIEETKTQLRAATEVLKDTIKAQEANAGSINEMRLQLKQMQKEYDNLGAAERKQADEQGGLRDQILKYTEDLKALESATGRNQRNVGNYTQSILEATKGMGALGKGVQGAVQPFSNLNNGMKAMAANPWMALISVAVTIVLKLTEAFKKNGAAMESLNKVFGIFQGIGVIVDKLIDKIAGGVAKLADGMINLAKRLGIVNEEMDTGLTLAQEQLRLAEQSRKVRMEEADTAAEIAELREKASDKENYSLQERIDALNKAQEKENEIAKEREAIAKREYELAKAVADQANSSQEDLDKVADAYVKWQNEIANTANANRQLNKQINAMNREAEREAEQRAKEQAAKAKAARDARLKAAQDAARAELDIERQLLLEQINAIEDEQSREVALAMFNGQREIDALIVRLQTEKDLTEKAKEDLQKLIEAKQEALNETVAAINQRYYDAEVEAEKAKNEQIIAEREKLAEEEQRIKDEQEAREKEANDLFVQGRKSAYEQSKAFLMSLGDVAVAFTNDEKKRAKIQKGLAVTEVAISEGELIANTAKAISAAVAGAASAASAGGPLAPVLIAAYTAEMVAAVLAGLAGTASSIAKAKSIISGGAFAEGGIVGGSSYQGDRVITRTNSGEMILTKSQQAQLFNIANGAQTSGFNYEAMMAMMTEAFASAPAPILDYQEFTQFQNNVASYREFQSL